MSNEGVEDGVSPVNPGHLVHVTYLAGYIFLSYVISSMGCATTLELLHRRTSRSGFYNWYAMSIGTLTPQATHTDILFPKVPLTHILNNYGWYWNLVHALHR